MIGTKARQGLPRGCGLRSSGHVRTGEPQPLCKELIHSWAHTPQAHTHQHSVFPELFSSSSPAPLGFTPRLQAVMSQHTHKASAGPTKINFFPQFSPWRGFPFFFSAILISAQCSLGFYESKQLGKTVHASSSTPGSLILFRLETSRWICESLFEDGFISMKKQYDFNKWKILNVERKKKLVRKLLTRPNLGQGSTQSRCRMPEPSMGRAQASRCSAEGWR